MHVPLPDGQFQVAFLQRSGEIEDRLVGNERWLVNVIVSHISLEPRKQLDAESCPRVPAFQPLVLVVVMLEVESGEEWAVAEVVVDLDELPPSESVVFLFLGKEGGRNKE